MERVFFQDPQYAAWHLTKIAATFLKKVALWLTVQLCHTKPREQGMHDGKDEWN